MKVSGQLHALPAILQKKEPKVPTEYEAGWTPESVWTLWKKEKFLTPAGNETAIPQSSSPQASHYTNYAILVLKENSLKIWCKTLTNINSEQISVQDCVHHNPWKCFGVTDMAPPKRRNTISQPIKTRGIQRYNSVESVTHNIKQSWHCTRPEHLFARRLHTCMRKCGIHNTVNGQEIMLHWSTGNADGKGNTVKPIPSAKAKSPSFLKISNWSPWKTTSPVFWM